MPSFFSSPGGQKKRKRDAAAEVSRKKFTVQKPVNRARPTRRSPAGEASAAEDDDEEISGSESESDAGSGTSNDGSDFLESESSSDAEGETAAEKRLRLAERYLENVRQEIDPTGFDAEEIDRELIASRLREDVAESKGKVYRQLAHELDFSAASHTFFRCNAQTTTSVAVCPPNTVYTATKDLCLIKWRLQDPPALQYPQTTKKKPKRVAPPRRQPERVAMYRGRPRKKQPAAGEAKGKENSSAAAGDVKFHTGPILSVAASADGRWVATGGEDRRVIVYDAATLRPVRVFAKQHKGGVTGLVFRRGTGTLYSCSRDRTVKVWSLDQGDIPAYVDTLFGHAHDVVDIDALALERCVTVGSMDRTARLWKVVEESQLVFRGGAPPQPLPRQQPLDGKEEDGKKPEPLRPESSIDRVAMVDEELFVTGSNNGSLTLWSIQKKKPLFVLPLAHGVDPRPPLREEALVLDQEGDPRRTSTPPPQPRWITALRTVPYSDVILSGSWDGYIRVWKLNDDKRKIEPVGVLGHKPPLRPDGRSQVDGEEDGLENGYQDGDRRDPETMGLIRGFVNDIAVFERGNRGADGLCVVAAVGKEARLDRTKRIHSGGRNGAIMFEVPRQKQATAVNGNHVS